jgi:glycosyltransferase involved in cell wall biosynthesis
MISFVVPAHNEVALIGHTLAAIHGSAQQVGLPYEVIVVDDASTDATAEVAGQYNARVVSVYHRHIAATRNAGARSAQGGRLFFVDADTTVDVRALESALRAMDRGAVGGAATVRFDAGVPLYARLLVWYFGLFARLIGVCGGAFLFCTRDAFDATGGFNENLYGAEDAAMCWALKCQGPFRVLWRTVETSGRRVRGIHGVKMMWTIIRLAFAPWQLRRRAAVANVWYNSNRENDDLIASSLAIQISNAIGLLVLVLLLLCPVWIIPWPQWLYDTPLGWVKLVGSILGLHVGLLLLPCCFFLFRGVFQQTRPVERLKVGILLAICAWLAWRNSLELIAFYRGVIAMIANELR